MIKFITGYSGYGGSTIMFIQHCNLLNEKGYKAELYGREGWHLDRCPYARKYEDLIFEEDDILIYHFMEPESRPSCKKVLLMLQETSLYDLKSKPIHVFDDILFVSEAQKNWHSYDGGLIMPNRMNGLVDVSLHSPPNKNVAGIVGNIHPIKRPDLAVRKAIEDNMQEIILFGPICDGLSFEEYCARHMSEIKDDRVKYGGFVDPNNRMDIYNRFDVLYHFGEFESACITLGECRILGKPVVKCNELHDYPILTDEEILEKWKSIIDGK